MSQKVTEQLEVPVPYGTRCTILAKEHPDSPALIFVREDRTETVISWRKLDRDSTRFAYLLREAGADNKSIVVVGLKNSPEHFVATIAAWKLGSCVLPLNALLPMKERDQILDVAKPNIVVSATWNDTSFTQVPPPDDVLLGKYSDNPLPPKTPSPGRAIASGGSTGQPKIIVDPNPLQAVPGGLIEAVGRHLGVRAGQVQIVSGPLHHSFPFDWNHMGLFEDQTMIVMQRFDAELLLDLVERHQVNFLGLVPTMMRRIVLLPTIEQRDLSSIEAIFHASAPCPPWVKRAWIDLLGSENVFEAYGATESVGQCLIRGDEWLSHPGSVGRPFRTEMQIRDENGRESPRGSVGEIFMRSSFSVDPHVPPKATHYVGSSPLKQTPDGFRSVGDLGWMDEDGYLYLADRRVDMIISGGANVYPAEVEAALSEHPGVGDVAVIGIPNEDLGKSVHAIVEPLDHVRPPNLEELDLHCRTRLSAYKVPRSYEFVDVLPRDEAGKIRRSQLVSERSIEFESGQVK